MKIIATIPSRIDSVNSESKEKKNEDGKCNEEKPTQTIAPTICSKSLVEH